VWGTVGEHEKRKKGMTDRRRSRDFASGGGVSQIEGQRTENIQNGTEERRPLRTKKNKKRPFNTRKQGTRGREEGCAQSRVMRQTTALSQKRANKVGRTIKFIKNHRRQRGEKGTRDEKKEQLHVTRNSGGT